MVERVPKDVWKIVLSYLAPHDRAALLCVSRATSVILGRAEKKDMLQIAKTTQKLIRMQQRRKGCSRGLVLKHFLVCWKCGTLLSQRSKSRRASALVHMSRCAGPTLFVRPLFPYRWDRFGFD